MMTYDKNKEEIFFKSGIYGENMEQAATNKQNKEPGEVQPMRVVVSSESSLGDANGVSNSVRQTLKYLRDNNHEAIVIAPKPSPKEFAGFPVVGTRSIPMQGFNLGIPGQRKVPRVIERFQPDVVHVASPAWTIGRTALSGAQLLDIPSVAIYQTDIANYSRRFRVNTLTQFTERWVADIHNRATRNLVPSAASRDDLIRFGVREDSIHHWGRGVDSERFHPQRKKRSEVEALRDKFSQHGKQIIVGYVGRLAVEKSVERLAQLKDTDARLVVVGDGTERKRLESTLPKGTIFMGELRGKKLADAYAAFDVFVHTGTQETFGQTLQEAMASGLPVVAPAIGGPLDIVQHEVTGLLYEPFNDDSLVASVEELLHNKEKRREMGKQGRRVVEQKTWSKLGDELLEHYREAINQ